MSIDHIYQSLPYLYQVIGKNKKSINCDLFSKISHILINKNKNNIYLPIKRERQQTILHKLLSCSLSHFQKCGNLVKTTNFYDGNQSLPHWKQLKKSGNLVKTTSRGNGAP